MPTATPTAYSNTDTPENEAHSTLLQLLDLHLVKPDIRTRDKYPNVDGTIELVDASQVPRGKLEVQLRTIGEGETKYGKCSSSLVAYSAVSTLPVILICADPAGNRAYWKRIHSAMPEYRDGQKTFTIHFDETADAIDTRSVYRIRWLEIIRDYQNRILSYPELQEEFAHKLSLDALSKEDVLLGQAFLDGINDLLGRDFVCVKEAEFPGVWKFGVAISSSESQPEYLTYQIYEIPRGELTPLVTQCSADAGEDRVSPHVFRKCVTSRQSFGDPRDAAQQLVLELVGNAISDRSLPVYSTSLASDILVSFVDRYANCLALTPGEGAYSRPDLSYALHDHLLGVCATVASGRSSDSGKTPIINLDDLSSYLRKHTIDPMPLQEYAGQFAVKADLLPTRTVYQALSWVIANEIDVVERVFARRTSPVGRGGTWVWSGFSKADEIASVRRVLETSIEEYSAFVSGNRLNVPDSVFLNNDLAIVYNYHSVNEKTSWPGPTLHVWIVDNQQHRLPKVSVFTDAEHVAIHSHDPLSLRIGDAVYRTVEAINTSAISLFRRLPVLSLIYGMLRRDLRSQYDLQILDGHSLFP